MDIKGKRKIRSYLMNYGGFLAGAIVVSVISIIYRESGGDAFGAGVICGFIWSLISVGLIVMEDLLVEDEAYRKYNEERIMLHKKIKQDLIDDDDDEYILQ